MQIKEAMTDLVGYISMDVPQYSATATFWPCPLNLAYQMLMLLLPSLILRMLEVFGRLPVEAPKEVKHPLIGALKFQWLYPGKRMLSTFS
jgi:hypothetical protein